MSADSLKTLLKLGISSSCLHLLLLVYAECDGYISRFKSFSFFFIVDAHLFLCFLWGKKNGSVKSWQRHQINFNGKQWHSETRSDAAFSFPLWDLTQLSDQLKSQADIDWLVSWLLEPLEEIWQLTSNNDPHPSWDASSLFHLLILDNMYIFRLDIWCLIGVATMGRWQQMRDRTGLHVHVHHLALSHRGNPTHLFVQTNKHGRCMWTSQKARSRSRRAA